MIADVFNKEWFIEHYEQSMVFYPPNQSWSSMSHDGSQLLSDIGIRIRVDCRRKITNNILIGNFLHSATPTLNWTFLSYC